MRWIANYLRQVFCRHEWQHEEARGRVFDDWDETLKDSVKVSATCKRCGYHRSYWKF